jgi:hypothetical protein
VISQSRHFHWADGLPDEDVDPWLAKLIGMKLTGKMVHYDWDINLFLLALRERKERDGSNSSGTR